MTVLADHEIIALAEAGAIQGFVPAHVQPASYDVRLGGTFRVFHPHRTGAVDLRDPESWAQLSEEKRVRHGEPFILHSGQFALGRTEEVFDVPDDIVVRLEGKSTIARLAMAIHVTGGFIDPGFEGSITLEFVNFLPVPIKMWVGDKIGQVCFMRMSLPPAYPYGTNPDYANRYKGQTAATAAKANP
jgi:dCTP deaminase